jgi:hypothetical protein
MYFSSRTIQVRNTAIAVVNGIITLIILLIAPLGLVAVMINTLLVAIASYATALIVDRVSLYLQGGSQQAEILSAEQPQIRRAERTDLDQH